jgi:biopolymer transport protein ExbD
MSEINLTPLIDLSFLLLVTFIITFPMIEQGIFVNLPKGRAKTMEQEKGKSVTVDKDGLIYLEDRKVTIDELRKSLGEMSKSNPNLMVMVRGDETVRYGQIMKVLKIMHDLHITRMALVTKGDG